jgi:hypothetical protein
MKFENILVAIVVSLLVVTITANSGAAVTCGKYTIDGDLSDWGVDLSQDWSQNSTWLPNSGVSFVVEDNRDPRHGVLPYGVHIRGKGSSYFPYEEPKIKHENGNWVTEPYGGEHYDMEALYFDEDASCIYVALITSEEQDGQGDLRPGDLALDLDRDLSTGEYGYEYGVKLEATYLNQFDIYSLPVWEPSNYFPTVAPTFFKSASSNVGSATGAYVDSGINDNGYNNYVVEVAIPKSLVGDPADVNLYDLYIAESCGNDYIPAPEFVFAAIPVAIIGIVLVFAHRSAKKKVDLLQ